VRFLPLKRRNSCAPLSEHRKDKVELAFTLIICCSVEEHGVLLDKSSDPYVLDGPSG
jgi:hypothetical protein